MGADCRHKRGDGFTLIELSIVLVVIGLIVGGILVGQNLIIAAAARAQISQIEKYNTAVRTFQGKYNNYLPGDIPNPYAAMFGFQARGTSPGQGDGNGLIEDGVYGLGWRQGDGETVMFWVDLSTARLIDGGFTSASPSTLPTSDITGVAINLYLPQAKIGNGNYVYVWSDNCTEPWGSNCLTIYNNYPDHWFGISAVTTIQDSSGPGSLVSSANIQVVQAYNIDKKIDDGLPLSGSVQAIGIPSSDPYWAVNSSSTFGGWDTIYHSATTSPSSGGLASSSTSCIDNQSNPANPMTYSIEVSGGNGANCAISFRFQ